MNRLNVLFNRSYAFSSSTASSANLESLQEGGAILKIWRFQCDLQLFGLRLIFFIACRVNVYFFTSSLVSVRFSSTFLLWIGIGFGWFLLFFTQCRVWFRLTSTLCRGYRVDFYFFAANRFGSGWFLLSAASRFVPGWLLLFCCGRVDFNFISVRWVRVWLTYIIAS